MLEDALGSQVNITHYHRTYFPRPGLVATGITLRRKSAPDLPPLGSADKLIIQSSWPEMLMLRKRVSLVEITNLHIVIPPPGSRANQEDFPPGSATDFDGPATPIEQLQIHNGALDIMRPDGTRLSFPVSELHLRNFVHGKAMKYSVDMRNAKPSGHIQAIGSFGPIDAKSLASTPLSGNFTFTSVSLHDVGNIWGTLSSSGHFKGTLASIQADASSVTPDFAVENGVASPVAASVQCTVNGLTGDVVLHSIDARTGATTIHAQGSVAGSPKVTNLDIAATNGRAEDVLRPFMHKEVPIVGPVWLHSHAYIAPSIDGAGFLQRLRVDGVFDVPTERLTNLSAEKGLSAFSQRAQGDESEGHSVSSTADELSSVKGSAQIRNGIISSPRLTFIVSGAQANLSGTFNLHGQIVHLVGNLTMKSDISHATTGFKSFLLKPLAPFFKSRHAGAVIPIAVTGGPGQYKVSQDIMHNK